MIVIETNIQIAPGRYIISLKLYLNGKLKSENMVWATLWTSSNLNNKSFVAAVVCSMQVEDTASVSLRNEVAERTHEIR